MRVYFDLDSRQLIASASSKTAVAALNFTRGDTLKLEVQFVSKGAIVDHGASALFFCVKPKDSYAGDPYALSTEFTKSGDGSTAVWTGYPSFNTTELATAFGIDPVDSAKANLTLIEGIGEIGYDLDVPDIGTVHESSRLFRAVIANDVYRGNEAATASFSPGLDRRVDMPGSTTDAGEKGDYAVNGEAFAVYVSGTGWVFFPGYTQ